MALLTREERRRQVLEHHSQGMGTREIAKLLYMSFTDIAVDGENDFYLILLSLDEIAQKTRI